MKTSALMRRLLRELDVRLAPAGFRRGHISWLYGDYRRELTGIQHILGISIRPYLDVLEAEVGSVSVRFDTVEDLVAKFEDAHPLIGPEDIAARSTLFVQLSSSEPKRGDPLYSWGGTARKIWLIHAVDEAPDIASQITTYALEKCEPLFVMLSNADQALTLLSADDERSRSYSGPDEARAKQAIALAFLLHGDVAARQLATAKLARLKGEARSTVASWTDRFFRAEVGDRKNRLA